MCPEFKRKSVVDEDVVYEVMRKSVVDEDFVYEVMGTPGVLVKRVLSKQKRPMGPS